MSLLADIGTALQGALGGPGEVFPAATLHVTSADSTNPTIDENGVVVHAFTDFPCAGFAANWDARTMAAKGYDANTAKIVLVQSGAMPRPKLDDQVTVARPLNETTARYRITDVTSDPADATYTVAGVPV